MSDKQTKVATEEKVKTIFVRGTERDRKVVLWERDENHPTGEVVIVNNGKTYKVGETSSIKRLIGEEKLERVSSSSLADEELVPVNPPGRRSGRKLDEVTEEGSARHTLIETKKPSRPASEDLPKP